MYRGEVAVASTVNNGDNSDRDRVRHFFAPLWPSPVGWDNTVMLRDNKESGWM